MARRPCPATAPSGPLLDPRTSSKAFRAWFGSSHVVDLTGAPLVVYHGTDAQEDFETFRIGSDGAHFGTHEQANARIGCSSAVIGNARRHGVEPHQANRRLIPVYLSIRSPMTCTDQNSSWLGTIELAKARGHDGLRYRNEFEAGGKGVSWVAFHPEQIRSVFDPAFRPGLDAGLKDCAPAAGPEGECVPGFR